MYGSYWVKKFYVVCVIFLFSLLASCSNNKNIIKTSENDVTYLISVKIEDKSIEIVKFEATLKNKLKITIKNNSSKVIPPNSIAIFKEGKADGKIIKDTIKAWEEKTVLLNIPFSKKRLNEFHIFRKIN